MLGTFQEMLSVNQGKELFFDTTDQLLSEKSVVKDNLLCSNLDYDIWLREPQSVNQRRRSFLSKMGFIEHSPLVESEVIGSEDVSESRISELSMEEKLISERRESNSEANCSDQDWLNSINTEVEREIYQNLASGPKCENDPSMGKKQKKVMHWWRNFTRSMKKNQRSKASEEPKMAKMSVLQNKKRFMECTGVYSGQEIKAHDGLIWTMKFSPDSKYLASGGEDGVVCIWRVRLVETDKYSFSSQEIEANLNPLKKKSVSIIVPEKIFRIEEEPVQKLQGHSSDVLDLAWSTSNHLLSSSMDKSVRLWRVGSDECLGVFHHSNYVTCVQFNPMDENRFISGSIDGKVRIWGIHNNRVEDWDIVGDIVTAVCYQPNGKGFIVGSVSGNCRFYESSGDGFLLNAELNVHGKKKKSSGYKITGIQFLKEDSLRVLITSEDSKIRIFDGLEVVRKYRGLAKSGSQMSASFTSSRRHIISIGEDSHIYLWNYDNLCIQTSKQVKSICSCEHFFSEGVSVVLPWSPPNYDHKEASLSLSDSERFSLANWFSMEGSSRTTVTWPEEKLPSFHLQSADIEREGSSAQLLAPWGLVFVTANWDGTIRTFHNYGLPVKT